MARCKECIHGECCSVFIPVRTTLCNDNADKMCKLFRPTADVVPKSELDRLNAVMKEMDEQRAYTINMLGESLEKAKVEVARGIFEEVKALLKKNKCRTYYINGIEVSEHFSTNLEKDLADLKKAIFGGIVNDL